MKERLILYEEASFWDQSATTFKKSHYLCAENQLNTNL